MRLRTLFISSFFVFSILLTACGNSMDLPANSTNSNLANANASRTNSSNPLTVKTPTQEQTTNEAPALAPVVHSFYDALRKKDDKLLRSVMSREFLRSVEEDMKEDKRTEMAAYLAEIDVVPEKPVEVRNEKIIGDKAVVEIKGGAYPNWTPFALVREEGAWKFTGGTPDPQFSK